MLKDDVVKAMAGITGGTQKDARAHLDAFTQVIEKSLKAGEEVRIKGFATFFTVEREAYTARNPQNGKEVQVEAQLRGHVKLSDNLKKLQ